MNPQRFEQIKSLINMKLKNNQIQDILKISGGTVCAVKRNSSFAAYKAEQKAYFDSKKPANVPITAKQYNTPVSSDTPIYDVMLRIEQQLIELNQNFCKAGKAKGFRLF